MTTSQDQQYSEDDRKELFERVSQGVVEWSQKSDIDARTSGLQHNLYGFLRRYLRPTRFDSSTVEISSGGQSCDVDITQYIGIKLVYNLHAGSKETIHKELRSLLQDYEYVVIYGHQISGEYTDLWRMIKRTVAQSSVLGEDVIVHETYTTDSHEKSASTTFLTNTPVIKLGIIGVFIVLLTGMIEFIESLYTVDEMGQAFVGVVILVNIISLIFLAFILRYF